MLKTFEKFYSAQHEPLGDVVHLGAGLCSELLDYLDLGFKKIHLIEANEDFSQQLLNKTANHNNIKVTNALISANGDHSPFYCMNNPRFNSLKKPEGIKDYFPNLEILNNSQNETTSIASIIQQASLNSENQNLLISELQGAEETILQSLSQEDMQAFSWIMLVTGQNSLSKSYLVNENLDKIMADKFFDPIYIENLMFPFCLKIYKRMDTKLSLALAESELIELRLTKKLFSKSKIDLSNLRESYNKKTKNEQELIELILDLRDNLETISQHYSGLQQNHPELLLE